MSDLLNDKSTMTYETTDGEVSVDVCFYEGSAWLTPAQMAELFGCRESVIMQHIGDIYSEKELMPEGTVTKFAVTRMNEGKESVAITDHYNLDVIISVGYRVRSLRGTPFRQWAFGQLNQSAQEESSRGKQYLKNIEKNIERNSRSVSTTYEYLKKFFAGKSH